MKKKIVIWYIILNSVILLYSFGGVFSKKAASFQFLSFGFFLNYGIVILILAIYALLWQQIIKRLPLMGAYSCKAMTVVWGIVLGNIIFDESINIYKIIGGLIIIIGVVLFSLDSGCKND